MLEGEFPAQLVAAGARLAAAGIVRESEGNMSVRLDKTRCLVTATGAANARLRTAELVELPLDRDEFPDRATSEAGLHAGVYRRRPDVNAIVHAHPPAVLRLAALDRMPDRRRLEDGEEEFGRVVAVPHFREGSPELAEAVAEALADASACILSLHGAVTVGTSIGQALRRMLYLERAAARTLSV
jgi:L-fuculose-phosphate aldolase